MEYIDQQKNSDVYDFIKKNPSPVLATLAEQSSVDLAHVFVFVDLNFNCYFLSKIETRKVQNIEERKHVGLLFSDRNALQQVELRGEGAVLTETEEIMKVMEKIQEIFKEQRSEYWTPPASQIPGEGYAIIKISPDTILYRDYSREEKDAGAHEYLVKLS